MQLTTTARMLSGALGAAALALAHAQEAAPIESVTVLGHYDNAVGVSDAASQGSVTAQLLANRPALRTGEVLEFVPGLIVTQHSGDGKANQYFLRGFNLDHGTDFATWVDGMPVNMRSHAHGQGYADLNFLIPELVQRIDYKKGPYYADEGDFASAGAARIELARRLPAGIASATVGEDGYRRTLLADTVAAAAGNLLYALELDRNDGPWDTPERLRKYSAVLRYSQGRRDDGFTLTAMAYGSRWQATDQLPRRAVDEGLVGRFGSLDPSDGGSTARYSLSWLLRKPGAGGAFAIEAYAITSRLDLYSDFTFFLDDPVGGDQFRQSERRRVGGIDLSQSWSGALGGIEMRNKVGLQSRYDGLAPVGLYRTRARQVRATVREDRVREASAGLYAENVLQWLPGLRSIAALRYDRYRFDVAGNLDGSAAGAGIVSPKLSLVFGPWRQTEYFVNFGKGFHSNDARAAVGSDGAGAATPLVASRGAELGVRSEWVPGLQSSLALWRLDLDSELVFAGDAGDTEASRASRRHGIEWNNHYIAASWLLFDLDLALSHARYRDGDAAQRAIPGAIAKVASFGATVTGPGRWFGAFEMRYFGPRPLIEDASQRSAGTLLASARLGYRMAPRTRVTLDVFNLFDRRASDIDYYYASRLPGEPAAGVDDLHSHPAEPRSARLALVHEF